MKTEANMLLEKGLHGSHMKMTFKYAVHYFISVLEEANTPPPHFIYSGKYV